MKKSNSWKEEAWESFLKKFWDERPSGVNFVEYSKDDLEPMLAKYTKSGQGEIRIFHYEHEKVSAVKERGVAKIPLTRTSWALVKRPKELIFEEPKKGGLFHSTKPLTLGMIKGIKDTFNTSANPGETTLLAIANRAGIIADFYSLKNEGVLFTGGRQKAGVHIVLGANSVDMTKAQIEIDGGYEWSDDVVIAEMKSSFKQSEFDTNQALLPMLKWKNILKDKNVYALVLLAQTKNGFLEYWAYDLQQDPETMPFGMKIKNSKKYIIQVN